MRGRLTALNREKAQEAIDNHDRLKRSYFWKSDHGNGQTRSQEERRNNFVIRFRYGGELYRYVSRVSISRYNYYYKGSFWINDEKRDVRLFKSVLSAARRQPKAKIRVRSV